MSAMEMFQSPVRIGSSTIFRGYTSAFKNVLPALLHSNALPSVCAMQQSKARGIISRLVLYRHLFSFKTHEGRGGI